MKKTNRTVGQNDATLMSVADMKAASKARKKTAKKAKPTKKKGVARKVVDKFFGKKK